MAENQTIALDARLSKIAEFAGSCDCYADIGCDHGRLGAFMLQRGQCRRALLADISEASLRKARRLITDLSLEKQTEFCIGDGFAALTAPFDVAVIAGMGGATIAEILRAGKDGLRGAKLVLQANVAVPEVRRALCECGYAITDEAVVRDGRRLYIILQAMPGKTDYGLKELMVGPILLQRLPENLLPYAQFRLRVARKALSGAASSGDEGQMAPLRREIDVWEEVMACLQASGKS